MLHKLSYKTNSLMRCRYLSFVIPLSSGLALLLVLFSALVLPQTSNTSVFATDGDSDPNAGIATIAGSPSAALSIGSNSISNSGHINGDDSNANAIISMTNDITVNAKLINSYNLQIASGNDSTTLEGPTTINATTNTVSSAEGLANNTWGYSWNNGSYKGITTSNTTIANDSISSTGSVEYTRPLTFAAKFNKDANTGHYKAKVNLLLTATPKTLTTYTLSYDANGGSGAPGQQTISNYNDSHTFTISATKPTRSGHEFLGWATSSSATAKQYDAGGSITLQITAPTQKLWAVWKQNLTWSTIKLMQDMKPAICSSAPSKGSKTLTDSRDNNTYTVTKLDDGRCWMTQNLRIIGKTLKPEDSNVAVNYTIPNTIISDWTAKNNSANYANYSGNTSYGAYYSWYAATAGTLEATYSVCPRGWHLPSRDEFSNFLTAASITNDASGVSKIKGSPYNFPLSRNVTNGALGTSGRGYWWSSTLAGTIIYVTYIKDAEVGASGMSALYSGNTIRCIADR